LHYPAKRPQLIAFGNQERGRIGNDVSQNENISYQVIPL
jgi:hypothetical protein